ncbi:SLAM family member 5-like [Sinocyclocheilus grahami]|uniref:SLAM family member 5-like n=1 Tax=Sinocyclocheilus grahami TaxID=75366 RepID=UPI0007AC76D4|nr:PREDICTED: SLAM family member 5-like [Sinocyclocheilus grahami]
MEGDSVTLQTDTEIKKDDLILWRFGAEDSPMAEVNRSAQIISVSESTKGFKDRLHLDPQTGSLTVRNIRTDHSGIYKTQIIGNKMIRKTFNVTVYARLPAPVISRDCCSSSSSSSYCSLVCSVVNVGHVSLSWYKGNSLLSSISVSDLSSTVSLHLEVEYQEKNSYSCVLNNPISNQTQHLDISQLCQIHSARLPVPVITSYCPQNPSPSGSSASRCVLLCSVVNVGHVTLSWYKGNSLLSSISVSDLSISLSLPLEVEYQDKNTYRCVLNNPISNQTQHLDISQLCQPCAECVCCCNSTEAVIQLAVSALVGVATVVVLVYDIRSRRAEQKRRALKSLSNHN